MIMKLKRTAFLKFVLLASAILLTTFITDVINPMRDTLIVKVASSGGAQVIAITRLLTGLPSALFVMQVINKWKRKYSIIKIQTNVSIFFFICFFSFAVLFPYSLHLQPSIETVICWQASSSKIWYWFIAMVANWFFVVFYVIGSVWTLINLSIIFWHVACVVTTKKESINFFAPLSLIGAVGGVLAGILSNSLRPDNSIGYNRWVSYQLFVVCSAIIILVVIYRFLISKENIVGDVNENKLSTVDSIVSIYKNKLAFNILSITLCYYMTAALIELIWKERFRQIYLDPTDYIVVNSTVTIFTSIFFVLFSIVSFYTIKFKPWIVTAVITPVLMIFTGLIFLVGSTYTSHFALDLQKILFCFGSASVIFGVASKHSTFNTSKNFAYKCLPIEEQISTRITIESLGSRGGELLASLIPVLLTNFLFPSSLMTESNIVSIASVLVALYFIIWMVSLTNIKNRIKFFENEGANK